MYTKCMLHYMHIVLAAYRTGCSVYNTPAAQNSDYAKAESRFNQNALDVHTCVNRLLCRACLLQLH